MFRFLMMLLNQPNVIITSRPHAMLPDGMASLDLELETIGFYPDQLNDYISRAAFKDDPDKAAKVQSFLKEHPLIQGLVRIPIQLDALCYTWDDFSDKPIPQTMTAIYQAIETKLWQKKDVQRLEKQHGGQLVTQSHIESADMNQFVEREYYFLEGFAFTGLFNNVIDFDSQHQTAISKHFKLRDPVILPNKELSRLSFLRGSEPSLNHRHQSYHFLHLTFQEYFAARYFVRQWKAGKPLDCLELKSSKKIKKIKPAEFLQKYKYHVHYDIFWRFVSGLLDPDDEEETGTLCFFKTIEKEPRDLMGPVHQRLVMHCLNELVSQEGSSKLSQFRSELEDQLSLWLLFECEFTKRSQLAREMELPDQVLIRALAEASDETKISILESLMSRSVIQASIIDLASSWLSDSVSQDLKIAILSVLGLQKATWLERSLELTKYMTACLKDEDWQVRAVAIIALQNHHGLSPETMNTIAGLLGDENWCVREVAVKALQNRQGLSPEIVNATAEWLRDEDPDVQWAAVKALQNCQDLSPETMNTIVGQLGDGDPDVRWAAVEALQNQQDLSPDAVNTIGQMLGDEDLDFRWAAVEALQNCQDLSSGTVNAIAGRLGDEYWPVRRAAVKILQKNHQYFSLETVGKHMESLHRALMEESFSQHLYLYVADDETIYIVFGVQEVPFKGQQDHVRNALHQVQKRLKIPVPSIQGGNIVFPFNELMCQGARPGT